MDHERWLEIKAHHLGQRGLYMDQLLPAVLVNTVRRTAFPGQLISFHKARYKNVTRLKEKLMRVEADEQIELHTENYRDKISDHLGVRFITLLLEDRASVVAAIDSLDREGVIEILKSKEIRSFAKMDYAAQDPTPETVEVHQGGYSSHHFALRLLSSDAESQGLTELVFELQVRTIMEEAWSEIDHLYRYELKRRGQDLPPLIDRGFVDLSRYMASVSEHAETLCSELIAQIHQSPSPEIDADLQGRTTYHRTRSTSAISPDEVREVLEVSLRHNTLFRDLTDASPTDLQRLGAMVGFETSPSAGEGLLALADEACGIWRRRLTSATLRDLTGTAFVNFILNWQIRGENAALTTLYEEARNRKNAVGPEADK